MRTTVRPTLKPGDSAVLFDGEGPGCILHWWITYANPSDHSPRDIAHNLQVRVTYDGSPVPDIDLPLAACFGLFFDHDTYRIDSAAIKILPKNALNSYLPMPFQSLWVEIENQSDRTIAVWSMADWQRYEEDTPLTDLRLHMIHASAFPAEPSGSFLMADLSGEGFVAGMVKGVRVRDHSDAWYHSGGDLWLLDGEHQPRALRGIGGEDVFNMSFGIWDSQTDWVGAPLIRQTAEDTSLGSGYEGIMYRFFGPDPVWFERSAVIRFGSKANDLESVIYAYLNPVDGDDVLTVPEWRLAGPFPCSSFEDFRKVEWAEGAVSDWPASHTADFGQYLGDDGPAVFPLPVRAGAEHGWIDFTRHFRGRRRTNMGTQPCEVSAYAVGKIALPEGGNYVLDLGFDDWLCLWVNGEVIHRSRHERGFDSDQVAVWLPAGESEIRVKLSNLDNLQWRLWAFCLTARKAE